MILQTSIEYEHGNAQKILQRYFDFQPCSFKKNELKPKSVIDLFKQK